MRRLQGFFIIIIIACVAAACSSPIGSIGGSGSRSGGDGLFAVTKRVAYNVNELFRREVDLQVFVSYQGNVQEIDVKDVEFFVIENPGNPNAKTPVYVDEKVAGYAFRTMGRRIIYLEYEEMSTEYWIEVSDPFALGGPGEGNSDGSGIIIEWATWTSMISAPR